MNYCLSGVNPANPTNGGYEFMEWTGDVFHPGIDFKAIGAWQERAGLLETELESVKDTNNRLLEENQTLHNQVDGLAERLSHVEEAVGSVVLVFKDGTRREINV
jgi:chromosome segregation ATPase